MTSSLFCRVLPLLSAVLVFPLASACFEDHDVGSDDTDGGGGSSCSPDGVACDEHVLPGCHLGEASCKDGVYQCAPIICPGDDGGPDGPRGEPEGGPVEDCGAIELLPPAITVKTSDGSSSCDPTFTVASGDAGQTTDAGVLSAIRCPSDVTGGCPSSATEASCTFILLDVDNFGSDSLTVEVSEPGFEPVDVDGVESGESGCVPTTPATENVVTLSPAPLDAGGDGA